MQRQKLVILILAALLVIAIAITAYIVIGNNDESGNSNTNATGNQNQAVNKPVTNTVTNQQELSEEEKQQNEATRIATIFTERFGTYTGALSADNVEGLKAFVTTSLYASLKNQTGSAGSGDVITTRVLSVTIESFVLNKSAVAKVSTLRTNATQSQSLQQDLTLRLEKSGDSWVINQTQWGVAKSTDSL